MATPTFLVADPGPAVDARLTKKKKETIMKFDDFETPAGVVEKMMAWAGVQQHHFCLEPSAGTGRIAEALRRIVGDKLVCVELMTKNAEVLAAKGFTVHECDFVDCELPRFDRIVMNPPSHNQQDLDHVLCAIDHLRAGGILVAVMPLGVLFGHDRKTLEFWDQLHCHNTAVLRLPDDSFKDSVTLMKTVLLRVEVA
jgi:predicted RNA methylase